jgi:uncharacterized phage protein (TIGR01671 family)
MDNGKWVEGFYSNSVRAGANCHYIHNFQGLEFTGAMADFYVEPGTIGQYTGLMDKNGTKIFEGDIMGGWPHGTVAVKWDAVNALFVSSISCEVINEENGEFERSEYSALFANDFADCREEWEVIGNIHDNPELLTP